MHADGLKLSHLERAVELALDAEKLGNLPVGAVIVLGEEVLAEASSSIVFPFYHPGRHAETEALRLVPDDKWPAARLMTCYTTLEPCVMCYGALLLHGIGRIVFGASDPEGGATSILDNLPAYYADAVDLVPEWVGPVMPERCDELYQLARRHFRSIQIQKPRSR